MKRRPDKEYRLCIEGIVYRSAVWSHERRDGTRKFFAPRTTVGFYDFGEWVALTNEDLDRQQKRFALTVEMQLLGWIMDEQEKERRHKATKKNDISKIEKDGKVINLTSLVRNISDAKS